MNVKLKKTIRILVIIVFVMIFSTMAACVAVELAEYFDHPEIIHDIYLYRYATCTDGERFDEVLTGRGRDALQFMPSYAEVESKCTAMDFSLYDGRSTLLHTAITFTLDLTYASEDNYVAAKQEALARYPALTEDQVTWRGLDRPDLSFVMGKYECIAVDAYAEDAKDSSAYPNRVCLLCFNDEDRILRYLDFWGFESDGFVRNGQYIANCTDGSW